MVLAFSDPTRLTREVRRRRAPRDDEHDYAASSEAGSLIADELEDLPLPDERFPNDLPLPDDFSPESTEEDLRSYVHTRTQRIRLVLTVVAFSMVGLLRFGASDVWIFAFGNVMISFFMFGLVGLVFAALAPPYIPFFSRCYSGPAAQALFHTHVMAAMHVCTGAYTLITSLRVPPSAFYGGRSVEYWQDPTMIILGVTTTLALVCIGVFSMTIGMSLSDVLRGGVPGQVMFTLAEAYWIRYHAYMPGVIYPGIVMMLCQNCGYGFGLYLGWELFSGYGTYFREAYEFKLRLLQQRVESIHKEKNRLEYDRMMAIKAIKVHDVVDSASDALTVCSASNASSVNGRATDGTDGTATDGTANNPPAHLADLGSRPGMSLPSGGFVPLRTGAASTSGWSELSGLLRTVQSTRQEESQSAGARPAPKGGILNPNAKPWAGPMTMPAVAQLGGSEAKAKAVGSEAKAKASSDEANAKRVMAIEHELRNLESERCAMGLSPPLKDGQTLDDLYLNPNAKLWSGPMSMPAATQLGALEAKANVGAPEANAKRVMEIDRELCNLESERCAMGVQAPSLKFAASVGAPMTMPAATPPGGSEAKAKAGSNEANAKRFKQIDRELRNVESERSTMGLSPLLKDGQTLGGLPALCITCGNKHTLERLLHTAAHLKVKVSTTDVSLPPLQEANEAGDEAQAPAQCDTCSNETSLKLLLVRRPGHVSARFVPTGICVN